MSSIRETTLGGNQWLEENHRLKWYSEESNNLENNEFFEPLNFERPNTIIVQLKPMQIRTFIVKLLLRQKIVPNKVSESVEE